jgi:hypothetical protein
LEKDEILVILNKIKENIDLCCSITMDPDEVMEDLKKIEEYINGK